MQWILDPDLPAKTKWSSHEVEHNDGPDGGRGRGVRPKAKRMSKKTETSLKCSTGRGNGYKQFLKIREGRQFKNVFFFAYFGYFLLFWLFFLNSGGRDLPGEPVEIDFRPIFKKNEKI